MALGTALDGKEEREQREMIEEESEEHSHDDRHNPNLKTHNGIVLMPQPSDDPLDPLNWSSFRKHMAMATISYLAFVCYMTVTAIIPGTQQLADDFHVKKATAVYLGNTPVALYAVGPLLWSPLSHFIGRRPVMILGNIVTIVGTILAAAAQNYGTCMAGRILLGFGGSCFWCLGPPSIGDIFFRHEKGKKIGISTLAIVVAPFAGGIMGGGIINNKSLGWRWSQWISLILIGIGFLGLMVFVPETIYIRQEITPESSTKKPSLWARYGVHIPKRHPDHQHSFFFVFSRPFVMLAFPAVLLSSFWFGIAYMLHVGITSDIPIIFQPPPYNFDSLDIGLSAFSGLIGGLLGELYAGPALDFIAKRALKRNEPWRPEMRLKAIWPALVTAPGGLLMFGLSIQFGTSWVTPLVGQGIYIFGIEIATTVIQTYVLECYPKQGAEASLVFNLFRNLLSYTTPFFLPGMWKQTGQGGAFGVFAALIVFFFPLTIGVLMWRGKEIRDKGGDPGWSRD